MIKKSLILLLFSISIILIISSCNKTSQFEKQEQQEIDAYLEKNSTLNFEKKPSGLYYLDIVVGTGRVPVKFDTIYVKYTGKFLDGTVFDTNVGSTKTMELVMGASGLIEGFSEGLTYMVEGGKSLLLVPSYLGYGTMGSYPYISGYTPLLFEIQLVKVKAGPGN
jgi:FKBP-type peptidyl-prolyl cis-trans isomerase FkpA